MFKNLFRKRRFQFRCHECGEVHSGAPSFSFAAPDQYEELSSEEKKSRAKLTDDLCMVRRKEETDGDADWFIRAILEIPIHGFDEPFTWGIWVTQSQESFDQYVATYPEDQTGLQSFGWLPVNMPYYCRPNMEPEYLECDVLWGPKGQRPKLSLWPCDHEIAKDQRDGISMKKAISIAQMVMHDQ